MLDALYEWIQNIVFFLLLSGMVLDALPGNSYRKYVRFFAGTVVILLLVSPILRLSGIKQSFDNIYHSKEYEEMLREVESMELYFEAAGDGFWENSADAESVDTGTNPMEEGGVNMDGTGENHAGMEDAAGEKIEVEEIRIGE